MTAKKPVSKTEWIDPDDAPELTDEWFDHADIYHGNTLIRRGRPRLDTPKVSTTLRLDADVIAQFKAKGPKWQTRINDALREWLKQAG
jgi:uncharacterized protein (DUF4415 family)